jgi:hypothetical protein
MRRKQTVARHDSPAPRLAWWVPLFFALALIAIPGVAKPAQALTVPTAGSASSGTALASAAGLETAAGGGEGKGEEAVAAGGEGEGEDGEEEQSEAQECEEDEVGEGGEEGEEACKGKGNGGPATPQSCPLTSAKATVFVLSDKDKVRLQIRYSTTRPTAVAVDYGLHGSKGPLQLGGAARKRITKQGVLRLTKSLPKAQMAKVLAARGFAVRIRVLGAPPNCHPVFVRQLTVKRATPGGVTWVHS